MLFLASSNSRPQRIRSALKNPDGRMRWIYLGRDTVRMLQWEQELGTGFFRISYTERFQKLALEWRRPFLNWITDLSRKYDSLAWWSSLISERNTLRNSLYHGICYLGIAKELAQKESRLLIICESAELMQCLAASDNKAQVLTPEAGRVSTFRWAFNFFIKWSWYLLDSLRSIWDARLTSFGKPTLPTLTGKPLALVHSCIDESFFDSGKDRYFTVLPEHLEKQGYQVVVLPWLFHTKRSRQAAFQWFRKTPQKFLIPEDFYSFSDYLWSMKQVISQYRLPEGPQEFQGMDITPLVAEQRRIQSSTISPAKFVRYYRLIEKLSKMSFRPDIFLDTFENNLTEKPQVMAFRKFMPKTQTIGYQHWASPAPLLLCSFTTPEEAEIAPHPDRIVCYSPFVSDLLLREGFQKKKLQVGPSLRYLHLFNSSEEPSAKGKVLVVFSMEVNAASDLFHKLMEAFGDSSPGIQFWLKPHPMMTDQEWERATFGRKLPSHMEVVSGSMDDWISKVSCGVVGTSTATMEFVLSGKPVIQLGRETDFNIDSLHWFPEFSKPIYSADQLKQSVLTNMELTLQDKYRLKLLAEKLLKKCISPLSDATLGVFSQEAT